MIPSNQKMELPFLKILKHRGGEATPQIMYEELAKYFKLTESDLQLKVENSEENLWQNRVRYARQYLINKGFLSSPQHAIWQITEKGKSELINSGIVHSINKNNIDEQYKKFSEKGQVEFITFHPAYSYEEFIEGITVDTENKDDHNTDLKYILKEGLFKRLCKKALASTIGISSEEAETKKWSEIFKIYLNKKSQGSVVDFSSAEKYVLIIDEINRGDIAKIFGELITLLENDKRLSEENELIVKLPLSGDSFAVPPNLYIIATMNTADRSIALLDVALRRRFGFIEMKPDFGLFREQYLEKNRAALTKNKVYESLALSIDKTEIVNRKISADKSIGIDRQIGHSFFFKIKNPEDLIMVWKYEILPLLEEYCYGDYSKINRILFNQETDSEWISEIEGIKNISTLENLNKMLNNIKVVD